MELLVKQGCTVIAPDIVGLSGEIGPGLVASPEPGPPRLWYGYVLLGKSILGRQMTDVMRVIRFAEAHSRIAPGKLAGLARGSCGPLLLHCAAIEGVFGQVAVVEAPLSFQSLVMTSDYLKDYITQAVPAALTAYDLPDLAACIAPRPALLVSPRDSMGGPASAEAIAKETAVVTRAYRQVPARLKIVPAPKADAAALSGVLTEWLREP